MEQQERERAGRSAQGLVDELAEQGVVGVAATWVDNSGVTRVKAVPLHRLPSAAAWGIGASPVFDAFLVDDSIISGRYAGGPVGDLRLHPDLGRLTVLAEQPGWAWAPADRYTQDGEVHPQDQRSLARRAVADWPPPASPPRRRSRSSGRSARQARERLRTCCAGSGLRLHPVVGASDYVRDLLVALDRQGIDVDQIHPEYGAGQFEVSVAAEDPVGAADTLVLVRETVRATERTARHARIVLAEGARRRRRQRRARAPVDLARRAEPVHWRRQQHGLTDDAAAFTAGILDPAAGPAGDRRAVGRQLSAADPAALGRRFPGMGAGEPRDGAARRDGIDRATRAERPISR